MIQEGKLEAEANGSVNIQLLEEVLMHHRHLQKQLIEHMSLRKVGPHPPACTFLLVWLRLFPSGSCVSRHEPHILHHLFGGGEKFMYHGALGI